eukprot:2347075-Prymnesium_polylepis.1
MLVSLAGRRGLDGWPLCEACDGRANFFNPVGIDIRCGWDPSCTPVCTDDRRRKVCVDAQHAPRESHRMVALDMRSSDYPWTPPRHLLSALSAPCA